MDMSQKNYLKGEAGRGGMISYSKAIRRVLSIMFSKPGSCIPTPQPPFNAFCYLPPGEYVNYSCFQQTQQFYDIKQSLFGSFNSSFRFWT